MPCSSEISTTASNIKSPLGSTIESMMSLIVAVFSRSAAGDCALVHAVPAITKLPKTIQANLMHFTPNDLAECSSLAVMAPYPAPRSSSAIYLVQRPRYDPQHRATERKNK